MKRPRKDAGPGSPLLVKRYSNRKLYNTRESRYITLDELADLVKAGTEIRVVDNDSGEDLTSVTLSQILLENERKKRDALPRLVLTELIQKGDKLFDTVRRSISTGFEMLTDAETGLERNIRRLVSRGELSSEEGDSLLRRLTEWVKENRSEIEGQIDRRIQQIVRRLDVPMQEDVDRLKASVERLEAAVDRLESRGRTRRGGER